MSLQFSRFQILLNMIALFPFCCVVAAESPTRKLTAALIDFDHSSAATLLEAELFKRKDVAWVERTEIDHVLREQKLQTLFAPEVGSARVKLGQLLKAEVLILLREIKPQEKQGTIAMECVVCETKQGLRLRLGVAEIDKEPAITAARLEIIISDGLAKQRENITAIVAVSPLISDDLSSQYNYLQSAYAKLIEQEFLQQPGIVAVELAESQAISQELATAGEASLQRSLKPYLILGRFRHSKLDDKKLIALQIELQQGDKQLAKVESLPILTEQSQTWVRDQAADFLATIARQKLKRVLSSPTDEAKQLANRAAEFSRIGNWDEASALFEASLLLSPEDKAVQLELIRTQLKTIKYLYSAIRTTDLPRAHVIYRRTLELLEQCLQNVEAPYDGKMIQDLRISYLMDSGWILAVQGRKEEEILKIIAETHVLHQDAFTRIARFRMRKGIGYEGWYETAFRTVKKEDQREYIAKLAEEYRDSNQLGSIVLPLLYPYYNSHSPAANPKCQVEIDEFFEWLKELNNPSVTTGISQMRAFLKETQPPASSPLKDQQESVKLLRVQPVDIAIPTNQLEGCLPVGKGIDMFWNRGKLFLVKQPGKFRLVWERKTGSNFIAMNAYTYDGRYVWFIVSEHGDDMRLHVLDPVSEKVSEFTEPDGFPEPDGTLVRGNQLGNALCPIAPGKVLVVGNTSRTWFAEATFDGERKNLTIFHEAREIARERDESQSDNTAVCFSPAYIRILDPIRDSTELNRPNYLIGRITSTLILNKHPLFVDMGNKKVTVIRNKSDRRTYHASGTSQGSLQQYCLEWNQHFKKDLIKLGPTINDEETLLVDMPDGRLLQHSGRINIVGRKWWAFDPETRALQLLLSSVPWRYRAVYQLADGKLDVFQPLQEVECELQSLQYSQHYGLLAFTRDKYGKDRYYQVEEAD